MSELRSRKDVSKTEADDGTGTAAAAAAAAANGKHRFPRRGSSSPTAFNPVLLGIFGVFGFVILIVLTAPSKHQRHAGMGERLSNEHHKSMFKDGPAKQVQKVGKTGKVLHKPITSIKKEDLKGLVDNLPDNIDTITYEQAIEGRERLVDILTDAGVEELDVPTILSLPKWSQVTKLYGDGPVVVGLDTCKRFRETIPLDDASIGTAGTDSRGKSSLPIRYDILVSPCF